MLGCSLVALGIEAVPVLEGAGHHPAVDQVEFLMELPLCFCVVYQEAEIWRDPVCHGMLTDTWIPTRERETMK